MIGCIRFVGATLWTDYRIKDHRLLAMRHARERMNDYRQIALQRNRGTASFRKPRRSFTKIRDGSLRTPLPLQAFPPSSSPTICLTRPDRFKGDLLHAAYASDPTEIIRSGRPALWVHGHTHVSCDHTAAKTRVVWNPRGYDFENAGFDARWVVAMPAGGLAIL